MTGWYIVGMCFVFAAICIEIELRQKRQRQCRQDGTDGDPMYIEQLKERYWRGAIELGEFETQMMDRLRSLDRPDDKYLVGPNYPPGGILPPRPVPLKSGGWFIPEGASATQIGDEFYIKRKPVPRISREPMPFETESFDS